MFSFEKVSFFDNIVPLDSPSQSNSTQNLRPTSQESGSQETNIPLWRKVKKQKTNFDSQFCQLDQKQENQVHYQGQPQQKMINFQNLLDGQVLTGNQKNNCIKQQFQEKQSIELQGSIQQIHVLQKIDFQHMKSVDKFFQPVQFQEEQQKVIQDQDYDRKCAQLHYEQIDSIKVDNKESKFNPQQKLKNAKKDSGQKLIKLKLDYEDENIRQLGEDKQFCQRQKFHLPIESQQLKSHIEKTHQQIQQIQKLKERLDQESFQKSKQQKENQQDLGYDYIQQNPQNKQKHYQVEQRNQQKHDQQPLYYLKQDKDSNQTKEVQNMNINKPKKNQQKKPLGIRNSLSLYERIIEQNSSKPNMRLFVQMQNKFQPIRKTQTQKFEPLQLKQQIQKMSQSLPVDQITKNTKKLQIVNSVSTLVQPSFSIQKARMQKQFNNKIKQLQRHYSTRIQENNESYKQLFNQMKTQINHLQTEKCKLSDELYEVHREISNFKNIQLPKKQQLQSLQSDNQKLKHQIYELRQCLNKYENQSLTFHLKYQPLFQQILNQKLQQPTNKPTASQIYDQMTFLYEKLQIKELQCQKLQLQKNQLYVELRRQKQKVKQLQTTAQNQWNQNNLKYQALQKQLKILKFSYNQLIQKNQRTHISPQIYFNTQNYKQQQKIQQQIKQSLTKRYLYLNNADNLQKKIINQSKKSYLNPQQQQGLTRALRKKNEEALLLSPKVERIKNRFSNQIQHYRTPSLQKLQRHLNSQSKQRSRRIINQIKADIKLANQQNKISHDNKMGPHKKSIELRHHSPKLRNNLSPMYVKNVAVENINNKLQKLREQVRKQLQKQ